MHFPFPPASSNQDADNKQFGASGMCRTSCNLCMIIWPFMDILTLIVPFPMAVASVGPIPFMVELCNRK